MIEIKTLGRGAIHRDHTELTELTAQKQKFALLAYVAVEGPVSRDRLLTLFWPERSDEKARHSLSQVLYSLRRDLGEECLHADGDRVKLDCPDIAIDFSEFEAAAKHEDWEKALDLYDGPFLQQFSLPGAPEFEEWCSSTRARLARTAHRAFAAVVNARAGAGDLSGALAAAWRWAGLEPLEDEAQHALIALIAASGDRAAALKQYGEYRDRLARELEVEPLEQTEALIERIQAGESPEFLELARASRPQPERTELEPTETAPAPSPEIGTWQALLGELRKRRVFHVGLAYLAMAWLAIQLTDPLVQNAVLPPWVFPTVLFFLALGFPFVLIIAWAREHPRERPTDARRPQLWRAWLTRVRPAYLLTLLGLFILALFAGQRFVLGTMAPGDVPAESEARLDRAAIAVLPFHDLTSEGELTPVALGFTDALIAALDQYKALKVLPYTAVQKYLSNATPIDSIIAELGAGTVVEGTVTPIGEQVRVLVQMFDANTRGLVASFPYERHRSAETEILSESVRDVSAKLYETLGLEIREQQRMAGTQNSRAWEQYNEARKYMRDAVELRRQGEPDAAVVYYDRADTLLARAERADPDWIEPIVQRGWVAGYKARIRRVGLAAREPETLREGIAHADRALAKDSLSAAALVVRGTLRYWLRPTAGEEEAARLLEGSTQDLERAVDLDPGSAVAWHRLANSYRVAGRFAEAKQAAERAYEEDGFGLAYYQDACDVFTRLCHISLELQQQDDVVRWCSIGYQRCPTNLSLLNARLLVLASPGSQEPDVEEAWQAFDAFMQEAPEHRRDLYRPSMLYYVAAVLARAGLRDSALTVIDQAHAATTEPDPMDYANEANVWLQLGDREEALRLLALHLEARPDKKAYVAKESWWEPLHDDPRFQELLK